jgi:hypothetical protein
MLVARLLFGDNKNSSTEKYAVLQMKVPAITLINAAIPVRDWTVSTEAMRGGNFHVAAGVFVERMGSTGKFVGRRFAGLETCRPRNLSLT